MFCSVDIPGIYGVSKYNKNGDEIEYIEFRNDSITSKEIYINDNNDSRTTEYYKANGELKSISKLTSEFDSNGNLIKESEYENGKLKTIKNYKIEYYK